ncbi:MAG: TetR-like C-terminal domain-containing protein [Evtepia sp.]
MQENTRTQRTYDLLLQALTELLTEKTFDEIRVTDLCEKAGIHRSTFYAHFEDKRHLLTFGIQELMDIFLVALPSAADPDAFRRALYRIFKYFLKNKHEYTMLFLDPRNASAKQLFHTEFVRAFRGVLKEKAPGVPPTDLTLYSQFFTGGLFSVITWWLETDTSMPLDQLAEQFASLNAANFHLFSPETE